ncbi:MAG: hypothetical protein N3A64_00625, partial [Desulfobacterota bacterium]|nr:hypothetical protein [Thermodesulfobacteriota bacterium]
MGEVAVKIKFIIRPIIFIFWVIGLVNSFSVAEEISNNLSPGLEEVNITGKPSSQKISSQNNIVPLTLKEAIEIALQNNLNIQIEKIGIPLSEQEIVVNQARFDPVLFGEATNRRHEYQTSWALSGANVFKENEQSGKIGIRKLFPFGLETQSYYQAARYRDNSEWEGLDPQY